MKLSNGMFSQAASGNGLVEEASMIKLNLRGARLGIQTCWMFPQILHNNLHGNFPSLIIIAETYNCLFFGTRVNFPVSKSTFKIQKGSWIPPATPAQIVLATEGGGDLLLCPAKWGFLALQLSTWPSAYDATPCYEWRSTWVLCFSETFCTSFQHSQELSSNVSTQPIHTHHFGLFQSCCASWL